MKKPRKRVEIVEVEEGDFDEEEDETEPLAASDEDDDGEVPDRGPCRMTTVKSSARRTNTRKGMASTSKSQLPSGEQHQFREASTGLQIMALMKNDPQQALEALTPYMETLRQLTGDTMPDDIRNGLMTATWMRMPVGNSLGRGLKPTGCGRRMSAYRNNRCKRKAHSIWKV